MSEKAAVWRVSSSLSLHSPVILPSLAGRVRSGKATEVSRTRRYAERRGRMRREEEPTRLRSDRQSSYRSPSPFPWASPVGHFVSHSRYACRLPPYLSRPIVGPKGPPYGRIGRGTEDKRRDGRWKRRLSLHLSPYRRCLRLSLVLSAYCPRLTVFACFRLSLIASNRLRRRRGWECREWT